MRGAIVLTTDLSVVLMRGLPEFMAEHNVRLDLFASRGAQPEGQLLRGFENVVHIPFTRRIAPVRDIVALARLVRDLRVKGPYQFIHASTPKAGLLGMVAGALAGVDKRIYTVRGLRYEGAAGLTRRALELADRIALLLATDALAISDSVATALREDGVYREPVRVLGRGSSNGVDSGWYSRRRSRSEARLALNLPADRMVALYVGRVSRQKGSADLLAIWQTLRSMGIRISLVVVGDTEDSRSRTDLEQLGRDPLVKLVGWRSDVRPYYEASDLLIFPSHREGFGNAIIEAACYGIPAVAYSVTGCRDAIAHGRTGWLVSPHATDDFAAVVASLVETPSAIEHAGLSAQRRAVEDFAPDVIWGDLLEIYLGGRGSP